MSFNAIREKKLSRKFPNLRYSFLHTCIKQPLYTNTVMDKLFNSIFHRQLVHIYYNLFPKAKPSA